MLISMGARKADCVFRFLYVLLYLLALDVSAGTDLKPLVLSPGGEVISASQYAEFLEDPTRQLSLAQLASPAHADRFQPNSSGDTLNFGRTRSAYWVHFTVINQSGEPWYLLLDSLLGDEFDLYVMEEGADAQRVNAATTLQYAKPLNDFRRKAWETHFPQGEKLHIYMRATNGNAILRFPIEFLSNTAMLERSNGNHLLLGGLYSAMLLLAIYQVVMCVSLRESSYLFLSIHILAMLATIHRTNPTFGWLGFLSDTDSYFFTTPLLLGITSYLLFSRQILDLPRDYPKLNKVYGIVALFVLLSIGIVGLFPGGTVIPILLGLGLYFLEIPVSLWLTIRGNRIAGFFAAIHVSALLAQVGGGWLIVSDPAKWSPSADLYTGLISLLLIFPITWLQALRVNYIQERTRKLEAEHKAKDAFLAVMSHELRTPLHAIVGLSGLLRMDAVGEKQTVYLDRLNTAAQHQLHLVGNILDMAKVSTQNLQLDIQPFRLDIAIGSVVELMQQAAKQKGLKLSLHWQGDSGSVSVLGDRLSLAQILMNLLGNAVKYTNYGSITLTVTCSRIADNRYEICFEVADTGIGIPADKLDLLFEPFVQIGEQAGLSQGGVGLGLAISKHLVVAMGSVLEVNSEVDEGSCFFFTVIFEAASTVCESEVQEVVNYQLPPGLRVLLVDDSELNRFVGTEMLSNMGVNDIALAADGESAILQLQQRDFDVVLLDISMPGMDGFAVTRWLRQHGRNPSIPVIALSAHVLQSIREEGKRSGMNAFLGKPFEYHQVAEIVTQLFGRK
ncbi:hybrid sensor histidine kinase/response regulator [Thiothrix subterranea]|uniref:histidine kinase n=2 Tax=Thiothrix subterranea TaxID=2735563 RepID=A0ABU0Y2I7_9GAMM|nr:response regulator [Thiothrix subterranea]MDQ5766903.1 response regulator [Thiothrix subterranea]